MGRDGGKADSRLARAPSDEDGCERHFTGMESRTTADSPGNPTSLRACDQDKDSRADHRPGWLSCRRSSRRLLSIGRVWRKMGSGRHDSLIIYSAGRSKWPSNEAAASEEESRTLHRTSSL